ncbi:hypothetical protein P4E94_18915, partial [Pontiellaceae bacterium B12219]|nr:hypothetical protein [Pontiellaceae bacterium B12219]
GSDLDGDGLLDGEEVNTYGTDPLLADSDGDGWQDQSEVLEGLNPAYDENYAISYGQAMVTDNPDSFGLYTSNSISDLDMGEVMIQASNGWIRMELQLQQCTNLVDGIWTNIGDAVEWEVPATEGKAFYRIHNR